MAEEKRTHVTIYTDGACSGNPGPGGFGVVIVLGENELEISDGERETTNNRMELLAVIEGLEALRRPCDVTLCSDSKYVIDALRLGWAKGWRKNGWRRSDKQPAKNIELWERLLPLTELHNMEYVWVKGHAGHPVNERCDRLAVAAAERARTGETPTRITRRNS